jgi:hypothetical protein
VAGEPEGVTMKKRDAFTLDLFKDVKPAPVVPRFTDDQVKAWSRARRLSKAIARTLEDAEANRDEIAEAMSDFLEERISKPMLDNYASQEKDHAISAVRLAALVAVTGDARALNTLLSEVGLIVIEAKYEALLKREKARELREWAEREERSSDAEWKARR